MFVILKYASQGGMGSAHGTYSAKMVGMTQKGFLTREEAEPWLRKLQDFNPSVDYGIFEVRLEQAGEDKDSRVV